MPESKTLVLVRHAKSSWAESGLRDHDRPLNGRGTRDAPRMAARLLSRGVSPDLIVTSSAVRALTTARVFADELGLERDSIAVTEGVYGAGSQEIIDLLQALDDGYACVMVVGHNPTFTDLSNGLTTEEIGHLPTCSVVTLALDSVHWEDLASRELDLLDFDYPKKGQA